MKKNKEETSVLKVGDIVKTSYSAYPGRIIEIISRMPQVQVYYPGMPATETLYLVEITFVNLETPQFKTFKSNFYEQELKKIG